MGSGYPLPGSFVRRNRIESLDQERGLVYGFISPQRQTALPPYGGAVPVAEIVSGTATYLCACRPSGYVCVTGVPMMTALGIPHCNLGHPLFPSKLAESMAQ